MIPALFLIAGCIAGPTDLTHINTLPESIGPKNPPLTGYVILFGTGDVYEVLKSTGGHTWEGYCRDFSRETSENVRI